MITQTHMRQAKLNDSIAHSIIKRSGRKGKDYVWHSHPLKGLWMGIYHHIQESDPNKIEIRKEEQKVFDICDHVG